MARPKGSKNKASADIRFAVLKSFEAVGGIEYLKQVAKTEPKAYVALLAKVIPKEIYHEIRETKTVIIDFQGLPQLVAPPVPRLIDLDPILDGEATEIADVSPG